ncbi:hypothetical protein [Deinococcus fonticola]|uniref:hypothetical protein n=1 Tax=Deinococcus fonticola TaxID=2528713 RepID=UPI0010756CC0|nr:hypothetical protein [Deinococcus fonticola]
MTKRGKDELGAVLGNLRKGRESEPVRQERVEVKAETSPSPTKQGVSKVREAREAFTSRLRPSQRRWLKRWASDLEEELGVRVTVEDVLETMLLQVQEDESLRENLVQRLTEGN